MKRRLTLSPAWRRLEFSGGKTDAGASLGETGAGVSAPTPYPAPLRHRIQRDGTRVLHSVCPLSGRAIRMTWRPTGKVALHGALHPRDAFVAAAARTRSYLRARGMLPLLLLACLLSACAAARPRSVSFSAPSAAPVADKITAARAGVALAKVSALDASASVKRAQVSAAKLTSSAEVRTLQLSLEESSIAIDSLSSQLLSVENNLASAQNKLADYAVKVADQTAQLNTAIDDKNAALDQVQKLTKDLSTVTAQRNKLLLIVTVIVLGAVLFVFRRPLGGWLGIPIP